MLQNPSLKKPYTYIKSNSKGVNAVRRNHVGNVVTRTLLGNNEDFSQVEASKFLAKLNDITDLKK